MTGLDSGDYRSFKGDRILVAKFPYDFGDPQRWDVAVFKYPGGAKINFIKRLVGKPNELVRISRGDIHIGPLREKQEVQELEEELKGARPPSRFQEGASRKLQRWTTIARKPPDKLLAMLQTVFDNRVMPRILERGWPARWRLADGWTTSDFVTFETDGREDDDVWFRYEHRVPDPHLELEASSMARSDLAPRLITDFCAYNTQVAITDSYSYNGRGGTQRDRLHWVGDLAVKCTLQVRGADGEALLELVEGGRNMQCRIDVRSGQATLWIGATVPQEQAARTTDGRRYRLTAPTEVRGPGEYEIVFSNCDDQLRLWVDGELVLFGDSDEATYYRPLSNTIPRHNEGGPSDLRPVGIGSRGAALRIGDVKICRDVYYIAEKQEYPGPRTDVISDFISAPQHSDYHDWRRWEDVFGDRNMRTALFVMEADQFLMLGDNSAQSKDSRLWPGVSRAELYGYERLHHYVHRDLLIGKAVYIYWPHSWDEIRSLGIPFPFFPNVARMGFVR
jgi:signal peptidase I